MQTSQEDNVRIGYQIANDWAIHEDDLFWSRFSALTVANSIILGAIAIFSTADTPPESVWSAKSLAITAAVLAAGGLLVSLAWCLISVRGYHFYLYYLLSARELEEGYLSRFVETLKRGGEFAAGRSVKFDISEQRLQNAQLPCTGRIRVVSSAYFVILLFALGYLALLVLNLVHAFELAQS